MRFKGLIFLLGLIALVSLAGTAEAGLNLTDTAGTYTITNTWDGDTAGYNITLPTARLIIQDIYNYWDAAYMASGAGDGFDFGVAITHPDGNKWPKTNGMTASNSIIEQSETMIRVNSTATSSNWDMRAYLELTFHEQSPLIHGYVKWWNTSDVILVKNMQLDYRDFDWNIDDDEVIDNGDDTYVTGTVGRGNIGTIFMGGVWDQTGVGDSGTEDAEIQWGFVNEAPSTGWTKEFYFTICLGPSDTDVNTFIDEWDDEYADAFAAITGTDGATYEGRNNYTGAFDFNTITSNVNFTLAPVDAENNYTAILLDGNYTVEFIEDDGVNITLNTDYNWGYNATVNNTRIAIYADIGSFIEINLGYTYPSGPGPGPGPGANHTFIIRFITAAGTGIENVEVTLENSTMTEFVELTNVTGWITQQTIAEDNITLTATHDDYGDYIHTYEVIAPLSWVVRLGAGEGMPELILLIFAGLSLITFIGMLVSQSLVISVSSAVVSFICWAVSALYYLYLNSDFPGPGVLFMLFAAISLIYAVYAGLQLISPYKREALDNGV